MGISYNPSVAGDGLVFYYDMANTQKSWKGAPATNIYPIDSYISWPTETYHFWNGSTWTVDGTYTHPGVEGPLGVYLGRVRKYTSGALSSTWSGNSYAYVLKTATMVNGQSYAMSSYAYASADCNLDYITSSIEGASVSAIPGYSTSYDLSKKGTWQRYGLIGVTPATAINFIPAYASKFGTTTGVFTGFYMVAAPMVELGTFATPYVDITRSNTQAILDLVGNKTLTASSLTYHANNTFSFNGSNRLNLTISGSSSLTQYTRIVWIKPTSMAGDAKSVILNAIGNNSDMAVGIENGYPVFHQYSKTETGGTVDADWSFAGSTFISINNPYMIAATVDRTIGTNNVKVYLNGKLDGVTSKTLGVSASDDIIIGGPLVDSYSGSRMFYGDVYAVMHYNRVLSDTEVYNNFIALKSRYGL